MPKSIIEVELRESCILCHVANLFTLRVFFFSVLLAKCGLHWTDAMLSLVLARVLVCDPPVSKFI